MPMFWPKVREVEAHQWDGSLASDVRLRQWLGYACISITDVILIENRTGRVVARRGDWLVREDDGFYPLEPAVFAATYDEVSP